MLDRNDDDKFVRVCVSKKIAYLNASAPIEQQRQPKWPHINRLELSVEKNIQQYRDVSGP